MMTRQRQLKSLIHSRMDRTGEKYMVARRHVLNARPSSEYELRGGTDPETSAFANAFANRGIADPVTGQPISEALVLGVGGGLGAGYILWEFNATKGSDRKVVTLGFRNQWQYPDRWYAKVCQRLGVAVQKHETSSAAKARDLLDQSLDDGLPAIAFVSTADLPYWHLPAEQSGWWGYPITVYGKEGDRYLVDDRNTGRLTIGANDLAAARSRIPSYKNRLVIADPAASELDEEQLVAGTRAGLEEQLAHLSEKSASFSLPAFDKWAKMLTDTKNAKSWAKVFADGVGLVDALVSVGEQVDDRGLFGGSLRRRYAEFLDRAGQLIDIDFSEPAGAYVVAAERWLDVAAVCRSVPAVAEASRLSQVRRDAVERGDIGDDAAVKAAEGIAGALDSTERIGSDEMADLFSNLSEAIHAAVNAERDALEAMRVAVT
jgi:Butirosin biosynthesis protein H, N-terminal